MMSPIMITGDGDNVLRSTGVPEKKKEKNSENQAKESCYEKISTTMNL